MGQLITAFFEKNRASIDRAQIKLGNSIPFLNRSLEKPQVLLDGE
ncbi:9338_t:CDS:2, partial [Entrophospora sp. SA101]